MTLFYVKGKWVHINELIEKAEKYDEIMAIKRSEDRQYERLMEILEEE